MRIDPQDGGPDDWFVPEGDGYPNDWYVPEADGYPNDWFVPASAAAGAAQPALGPQPGSANPALTAPLAPRPDPLENSWSHADYWSRIPASRIGAMAWHAPVFLNSPGQSLLVPPAPLDFPLTDTTRALLPGPLANPLGFSFLQHTRLASGDSSALPPLFSNFANLPGALPATLANAIRYPSVAPLPGDLQSSSSFGPYEYRSNTSFQNGRMNLADLLNLAPGQASGVRADSRVLSDAADPTQQAQPTQLQWLGPLIDTLKPMIEGGADMFGAKKPPIPPLPPGMSEARFGRLLRWGKGLDAKPWTERLAKDPAFAKELIDTLQKEGVTKDMMGQWNRFYDETFGGRGPNAPEQFRYRGEGLRRLYDQFPEGESTTPAGPGSAPSAPVPPCPDWLCGPSEEA